MKSWVTCAAVLLAATAAQSAAVKHRVVQPQPEPQQAAASQLSMTVYNNNLALVQDVRRLDVSSGRSRIEFKDVSASIRPETVALTGKGLEVVEQNFD